MSMKKEELLELFNGEYISKSAFASIKKRCSDMYVNADGSVFPMPPENVTYYIEAELLTGRTVTSIRVGSSCKMDQSFNSLVDWVHN